jgi:hypothetical protein
MPAAGYDVGLSKTRIVGAEHSAFKQGETPKRGPGLLEKASPC